MLEGYATYILAFLAGIILTLISNWKGSSFEEGSDRAAKRNPGNGSGKTVRFADVGEFENDDPSTADENPDHLTSDKIPFQYVEVPQSQMLEQSAAFYRKMNERRSVRFLSEKPVPVEIIENIVRCAGTAPSGAHTEPWTWVVVSSPVLKGTVRRVVEDEEYVNYTRRMGERWVKDLQPIGTDWNKPYLTEAPHLLLLFRQAYSTTPDGKRKNHYYNELSCSISAGFALAAIHHAGLVTVTTTPLNCGPALRLVLDRPENEKLMFLFPIGYPAPDAQIPDFHRKPLEQICIKM